MMKSLLLHQTYLRMLRADIYRITGGRTIDQLLEVWRRQNSLTSVVVEMHSFKYIEHPHKIAMMAHIKENVFAKVKRCTHPSSGIQLTCISVRRLRNWHQSKLSKLRIEGKETAMKIYSSIDLMILLNSHV